MGSRRVGRRPPLRPQRAVLRLNAPLTPQPASCAVPARTRGGGRSRIHQMWRSPVPFRCRSSRVCPALSKASCLVALQRQFSMGRCQHGVRPRIDWSGYSRSFTGTFFWSGGDDEAHVEVVAEALVPPTDAIMARESGCTGIAEMSWFHGLSGGKTCIADRINPPPVEHHRFVICVNGHGRRRRRARHRRWQSRRPSLLSSRLAPGGCSQHPYS